MSDLRFLTAADVDAVAALVFELAAQLHVEREHRLALERVLIGKAVIDPTELDTAEDAELIRNSSEHLEGSLRRLVDILTEDASPDFPLRGKSP